VYRKLTQSAGPHGWQPWGWRGEESSKNSADVSPADHGLYQPQRGAKIGSDTV